MIAYHQSLSPGSLPGPQLDWLLAMGWYRMHQSIFTTTHLIREGLTHRVHWLRYPLGEIREHSSHRRIRSGSKDFRYAIERFTIIRNDHEELYTGYRASIDFDGAASIRQCLFGEEGVDRGVYKTHVISLYDQDHLVAGGYFDVGSIAGTSILHFYDPAYEAYSPGKYLMLLTADFLRSAGYEFYYPGYLVAGIKKMDYKLFMGKEATQYFDAGSGTWKYFDAAILAPEELTEAEQIELLVALGG